MGLTSASDYLDWDSPGDNGSGGNGGGRGRCPTCGQKMPKLTDPNADGVKLHTDAHDTERKAAARVFPKSGTQRHSVLMAINHRSQTDFELVETLGLLLHSVNPRRGELVDGGWVYDGGRRRPNERGQECIVWELTERARQELLASK